MGLRSLRWVKVSEIFPLTFEEDLVNIISDADDKPKEALKKELEDAKIALAKLDEQIERANNSYAKAGMAQGRIPPN